MGKLYKKHGTAPALNDFILSGIDYRKFTTPLTNALFERNDWVEVEHTDYGLGWTPVDPDANNEPGSELDDFSDVFVWYSPNKDAWCYRYAFGTYVFDMKSVGELEMILAREGFTYKFNA